MKSHEKKAVKMAMDSLLDRCGFMVRAKELLDLPYEAVKLAELRACGTYYFQTYNEALDYAKSILWGKWAEACGSRS